MLGPKGAGIVAVKLSDWLDAARGHDKLAQRIPVNACVIQITAPLG